MIINTFQAPTTAKYVALDTETHTYIDGNIVPDEQILQMMKETNPDGSYKYPVSWWRTHCTVKAWAYIIYAPDGFAILESFEEFEKFVAAYRIRHGWWYYAPFDYSVIDWESLNSGWEYVQDKPKKARQYTDLSNDFGARYSMTEVFSASPKCSFNTRQRRTKWTLETYDFRNLLRGGLDYLLRKFEVTDGTTGEPIRKLSMDYQSAGTDGTEAHDVQYMLNDARGLWWLIDKFGKRLQEKYQIDILSGKPKVMTSSGLAKVLLLRKMYPDAHSDKTRKDMYRKRHPMTVELDAYFRKTHLLAGGLVMLNPAIKGKHLQKISAWRYDYNSHYPARMCEMPDIKGYPTAYDSIEAKHRPEQVRIFEITELYAHLKPGFIPSWLDPISCKVTDEVTVHQWRDGAICLFDFELEELRQWYDIPICEISRTWLYNTAQTNAFRDFIMEHYADKQEASAAHDEIGKAIPKLIMNGCSGKFSQNPEHVKGRRVMDEEGFVRLEREDLETDEGSIMNIVQGAYITAQGRTILRQSCRDIADRAGKTVAECIYYTDTDSIHGTEEYSGCDPLKLGYLKQENKEPITQAIFLAPKCYAELCGDIPHGEIDEAVKDERASFHCKGVRVENVIEAYRSGYSLADIYKQGRTYFSPSAINVRGGKAILPLPKQIARKEKDYTADWKSETYS